MLLRVAQVFARVRCALPADPHAEGIVLVKLADARFELAIFLADETALAVQHQLMELLPCGNHRHTPGQHRLHYCTTPGLLDAMPQWVEKNVQTVEKLERRFL